MTVNKFVEITYTDGPVLIRSHNGNPINANYDLWNDIIATGNVPPEAEQGANYVLSLKKRVEREEDVRRVEQELIHALLRIASAWVFSGGSHMAVEARAVVLSRRFASNVDAIEKEYLTEAGHAKVTSDSGISLEFCSTYSQPPLAIATKIACLMESDPVCRRPIEYYQQACFDRKVSTSENQIWSYNLYKVREPLNRQDLKITGSDWSRFGSLLNNNDMRHAQVTNASPLSSKDVEWLFQTARSWIAALLRTKGITEAIG